jgi:phospholipase/lecithinase/hemolysin
MSQINKMRLGLGSNLSAGSLNGADPTAMAPVLLTSFLPTPLPADLPEARPFSTIYAFGDSLSDAGNDYTASFGLLPGAPYSDGRFTNGRVWVQDLARHLHLGAPSPSLEGGNDFAYGGAEAGSEPLHGALPIDLPSQLLQFEAEDPDPRAGALYTLSIGANDLLDAIPQYAGNPALALSDVTAAVNDEVKFVGSLIALGARTFDILNVPDLGKTPEEISAGTTATATSLSSQYDAALGTSLAALASQDHVTIDVGNTFALIDSGVSDPAAYGLKNVTDPVWTGNYYGTGGSLTVHGKAANTYLFFDQLHPTAEGHAIVAAAALSALHVA